MKQFIGLVMAVAGAAATLWAGYQVLSGAGSTRIDFAGHYTVTAMHVGLVGVLILTLGFLWTRD